MPLAESLPGSLPDLIAAQSEDDQTYRLRPRVHRVAGRRVYEGCATDLGATARAGWDYLGGVPDRDRRPSVLVGTSRVWTAADVAFHRGQTCPACGNAIRAGGRAWLHHCLVCSASSDDPRQWPPAPPLRRRRARLRGGVGTAA